MVIKIMALQRAYFNGAIIKPGTILEFKGKKIPSWAKGVNEVSSSDEQTTPPDVKGVNKVSNSDEQTTPPDVKGVNGVSNSDEQTTQSDTEGVGANESDSSDGGKSDDLSEETENELNQILDELITEGLDKGIYLENTENKTVIEQIEELKAAIEKANGVQN